MCSKNLILAIVLVGLTMPVLAIPAMGQDSSPGENVAAAEGMPSDDITAWQEVFDLRGFWSDDHPGIWLIPVVALVLGLVAGRICALVLNWVGSRSSARGWTIWEQVFAGAVGPANLALLTMGLTVAVANVDLGQATRLWWKTILLLYYIAGLWYASNLIYVVELAIRRLTAGTESTIDRNLGPLVRKTLRILLLILGVLFMAKSVFGQDIGAWLAGLGIAGLAVSLAAQDSLKNLFGSITIMMDRPFRVGERITFAGYDGVIEEIGFRSTKLRTLTGHLVTIPNSKIVNDPVENIACRPFIRRTMNISITYDTPVKKVEQAVELIRGMLDEEGIREPIHPVIDGDEYPPRVYFNDCKTDNLNIFVIYWFAPPAYWEFLGHAQKLNLRILEEFERAGIEFAFPTQTVRLAGDSKRRLTVEMLGGDLG